MEAAAAVLLTILFTHKIQYTKKRCCEVACLCPLQLLTESDDMLMMLGYFNPRNGYEKNSAFLTVPFRLLLQLHTAGRRQLHHFCVNHLD